MAITKDIDNGSEILFTAWNGQKGYTLDLNLDKLLGDWIGTDPAISSLQTAESTLAAAAVAATEYNASGVLFDGALTEFATAFNNDFTGVEWSLVAFDNSGVTRSIVSADTSATAAVGTNDQARLLAGTLDSMATQVDAFAATQDEDTYHITNSSNGAAYAGQFGSTYQGNVFDTSNTLGVTSNLYMVAQSSSLPADANQDGLVKEIKTASGTSVTATTYDDNGVWKLKIEAAGATDGTADSGNPTPTTPHISTKSQSDVDSFLQLGNDKYVVFKDGTLEKFTNDQITFTSGDTTASALASSAPSALSWLGGTPALYSNPDNPGLEAIIDLQVQGTTGNDTVIAKKSIAGTNLLVDLGTNDFINLGIGVDAADGGAGNDIIDGGLDSNFLTGGAGADTFFVDGRPVGGEVRTTWSTITDFNAADGDTVNIWGWVEGTSVLVASEQNGAAGFEGFTHHYDLDGNGAIDTSITFTGLTEAPNTNEARTVGTEGYQFYGA